MLFFSLLLFLWFFPPGHQYCLWQNSGIPCRGKEQQGVTCFEILSLSHVINNSATLCQIPFAVTGSLPFYLTFRSRGFKLFRETQLTLVHHLLHQCPNIPHTRFPLDIDVFVPPMFLQISFAAVAAVTWDNN